MVLKDKTPILIFFSVPVVFFLGYMLTQYVIGRSDVNLVQTALWSVLFGALFGGYALLNK